MQSEDVIVFMNSLSDKSWDGRLLSSFHHRHQRHRHHDLSITSAMTIATFFSASRQASSSSFALLRPKQASASSLKDPP